MHVTRKEYQMLELLSLRKGTTLTKEMFLNHLYGGHYLRSAGSSVLGSTRASPPTSPVARLP